MVEKQQIKLAFKTVLVCQRIEGASAVADSADHARDAVSYPGMGPDAPCDRCVGGGEFDFC